MYEKIKQNSLLFTKNGRISGNAIFQGPSPMRGLYRIQTDYGNKLDMKLKNIYRDYEIGPVAKSDHKHFCFTAVPE